MKIGRRIINLLQRAKRPFTPAQTAGNDPVSKNIVPTMNSQIRYSLKSKLKSFLGFSVEKIDNPSLKLAGVMDKVVFDLQEVIKDSTGTYLPNQEVIDHLGDRLWVIRDGEKVIGFGTAKYFDHQVGSGKKEKITLLWGTMISRYYRRLGLMVELNIGLAKAAQHEVVSATKGFWNTISAFLQPTPIAVRSQSNGVFRACQRHFKGVVAVGRRPKLRYQEITEFVAGKMGWELDENNVQGNAYESARSKNRIHGLRERDAYAFSADFTLYKRALTWIMLRVVYPLRYHWSSKRARISHIC